MDRAFTGALPYLRDAAHGSLNRVCLHKLTHRMTTPPPSDARRAANQRTAWVLLSIALVFFAGIILKRVFF